MSMWGNFRSLLDERLHCAPCGKDGRVLPPHVLDLACQCKPTQDAEQPELVIHHDPQRGGVDG